MDKVVLVVDDSVTVRKFVSTSLRLSGCRVVTASDGMEALEKLPNENVDVIITDLNMPDMDGYEFIKNLRTSPAYQSIPVIVLSSLTDQAEKDRALHLGVSSYMEKPFTIESIQQEVARCTL
jgi:CheY-like chemotaxis protein